MIWDMAIGMFEVNLCGKYTIDNLYRDIQMALTLKVVHVSVISAQASASN